MIDVPPPRKRGRQPINIENHIDTDRKFRSIFPQSMQLFKVHVKEMLETNDDKIAEKYVRYVGKSISRTVNDDDDNLPSEIVQLGKNVGDLYNRLHRTSPFTYPYLNYLSRGICPTIFERLTGVRRETIYRARENEDMEILDISTDKSRSGPKRLPDEKKGRVITWIKNMCPVPSGYKSDKHHQYCSNKDLFLKYLAARKGEENLPIMSKSLFYCIHETINIRAVSFDFTTSCPWCDPFDSTLQVEECEEDEEEGSPKKTKEEHLKLKKVQFDEFQRIRASLKETEALIVMDFTSVAIPHAKSQNLFVNDLIITLYTHGGKHDWINYMSTSDNKQMYAYVEGSLHDFWSTYIPHNIRKVFVFSDGGPHHFKIWKTINLFHYLVKMYEIPIEYHFFESYHGSSLCDAHAGHVKKAIRYLIRDGTKITTLDALMTKIKKLDLKNATFELMTLLEETVIQDLKKVPGLKKMYKFLYDGKEIKMYANSTDTEAIRLIKF